MSDVFTELGLTPEFTSLPLSVQVNTLRHSDGAGVANLPDVDYVILYGWEGAMAIPKTRLVEVAADLLDTNLDLRSEE